MKFQNKEIKDMTDNELLGAQIALNMTETFVQEQRLKHKKLVTITNNAIGTDVNPAFVELKKAIDKEIEDRKLT